ncbi:MAG: error-prone DNA polymerase [Burkholderiales bacterium]|nr:error-prone DNA polymerase [Burkholderiales bacterium]
MAHSLPPFCELHCLSNFSFLRGASSAAELMERAHKLGYTALAITDECSLAGIVRAHEAAVEWGFKLIIGAEFRFTLDEAAARRGGPSPPASRIVLLAQSQAGYENLCALITRARARSVKGAYAFSRADLDQPADPDGSAGPDAAADLTDLICLYVPDLPVRVPQAADEAALAGALATDCARIAACFPGRTWVAGALTAGPNDRANRALIEALAQTTALPIVAANGVLMHARARKPLHDVLVATRLKRPIADCGHALEPNAERHLRTRMVLSRLYPPAWLEETLAIARACNFSLDQIKYEYPQEIVPPGVTPAAHLRELTRRGLAWRYPEGAPAAVAAQVEHELALIAELGYEAYFLTVYDIVAFARGESILCQGRGSAANSAVCYCLGVTEVDPSRGTLLFERFISKERNEPPDIDVDFEHERREEVMQYIYRKYGRDRAALAAAVATYRPKSAIRDVGRALGLSPDQLERLSRGLAWWDRRDDLPERMREAGLDPQSLQVKHLVALATQLIGFPRHLSQHSGGFVIVRESLAKFVPVENAAMAERTVIQWDKDDLEAVGLLKVDVLALGMLSAIRRTLNLLAERRAAPLPMMAIPKENRHVYDMLCRGESMGVFQVESRAQMSMLPRLAPREFYDLVIEVAIVRPGPIQGGMVHPYLRRRQGLEKVTYPSPAVQKVLERTLGVSIFQEQVMQLAVVAAGFTPGEADQLRRAMAAWKRKGGLTPFEARLKNGMAKRGYAPEWAEQIYRQMLGFGEYGFPESHAASFALLVYVSSWLKCFEPAAFFCALVNSQPMGFYTPSQLLQEARRLGIKVQPVDVTVSQADCTLEDDAAARERWRTALAATLAAPPGAEDTAANPAPDMRHQPAIRLGLRLVKHLSAAAVGRIVAARQERAYDDVDDLVRRAELDRGDREALSAADALATLAGHRRQALWQVAGIEAPLALLPATATPESRATLPAPAEGDEIIADYATTGLTLRRHPLALLRPLLTKRRLANSAELAAYPHKRLARAAGIVVNRQRPETAKGVIFLTLEDETGNINVVCWPHVIERARREILTARLLTVYGVWETDGKVHHLIAKRVVDDTALLGRLATRSRDFH